MIDFLDHAAAPRPTRSPALDLEARELPQRCAQAAALATGGFEPPPPLENELSVCLPIDPASARITVEGSEVLRHAEQMIGLAENFRARFGERGQFPKSIRMGAADSFALTYLSPLLQRLADLHPGTHIDLEVGFSANLDRKLQAGELDIAFLTSPTANASVSIEPLLDLDVAWLASPKLGIHGRRLVPADLQGRPIITNPHPSHLYTTVHDWFAGAGTVPQRLHPASLTVAAKLTADGIWIAVLAPVVVRRELARDQADGDTELIPLSRRLSGLDRAVLA